MKRDSLSGKLLGLFVATALLVTGVPAGVFAAEEPAVETEAVQEGLAGQEGTEEQAAEAVTDEAVLQETEAAEDAAAETSVSADLAATDSIAEDTAASSGVEQIEVNQGFSYHTGLNDGEETYLTTLVAKKKTAVIMKIPGSDSFNEDQAKQAAATYKLEAKAVVNGQESDNCELTAEAGSFSVKRAYDKDCDMIAGWYAIANFPTGPDKGTYNFHIKSGDNEVGKQENVTFYETQKLNVLVVPVNAYWSASYKPDAENGGGAPSAGAFRCMEGKFRDSAGNEREWKDLLSVLKEYMLDVYPIADINFEEGQEVQANDASYDMCNEADKNGQKKLWEEACKLQTKTKDGKDRYDLILAFVQYRQDQGGGQGYTFGKPTNIITYSDRDMLPTVAHEIAHCYQVGDEYDGGSFNPAVNMPPNGYKGRDFTTGNDIAATSGANAYWKSSKQYKESLADDNPKKAKIDENGAGTMVSLGLRPYSLSKEDYIKWAEANDMLYPTLSWMGSGFSGSDGYYFTSSVIWDHLLKQLVVKEKKEEDNESGEQQETSNIEVYENAVRSGAIPKENVILEEEDFYYDDDCRFGESRMVEVFGWLKNDGKVSMNPLFSYDGDLETIEVLDDTKKKSNDVYTFAAVDADGKVIKSPVDDNFSAVEFFGGFFNGSSNKTLTEVNFNFDAEYPEGTADFIIVKGHLNDKGEYSGSPIWKASADTTLKADFEKKPDGYLSFAEVNSTKAKVEWEVYYPEDSEEPYDNKDKALYTEVYYCPEGDDGEAYYVSSSKDSNWKEGYIEFDTNKFKTKWTRNAYVWIKVTNGVNAVDIFSDENEVTLSVSKVELSGAGLKKKTVGKEVSYSAECTGAPITPNVSVKAMDPSTGNYISLKKDEDYTVTYKDNVNVGYASVIVQGIGAYAGKNTQEFEITKKALAGTPDSIPDIVYSKDLDKEVTSYLSVKDKNGSQLICNKDFSVKFTVDGNSDKTLSKLITKDPEDSIAVTVTYTGKGNFKGECKTKVTFDVLSSKAEVTKLTPSSVSINLSKDVFQYSGKAVKPAIKSVIFNPAEGEPIKLKGSNYKVIYTDNTAIGTGRVTIVGKKGYTGSAYASFTIEPKQVTSLSVTGVKNQIYTGNTIAVDSLPITVKAGNIILKKGRDYTVAPTKECDYKNVTAKGARKPEVTITLITLTDKQKASMKKSEQPCVEWAAKVKDEKKIITKNFSIVKTKLNSSVVSMVTKSNVSANNIVKSADGSTKIGTIRSADKNEMNKDKKKYTFVITGDADSLEKDAKIDEGAVLKAFGDVVDAGCYDVTVSKTGNGKIGSIKFKAKSDTSFTGSKTVKFKYIQNGSEK